MTPPSSLSLTASDPAAASNGKPSSHPSRSGRGRPSRSAKKNDAKVAKREWKEQAKKYKAKYDAYLINPPKTNSPFDLLISAAQVRINIK